MAKRIEIDGKFFRERRGKLVEIPPQWVGATTHASTIRARPSKLIHKRRKAARIFHQAPRDERRAAGPARASSRREHES
jgi:hypothetical protein